MLALLLFVVVGIPVGVVFGWKFVLAPLLGYLVWRWATATMRSMAAGAPGMPDEEEPPGPVTDDDRTLYWCEQCGTELLLLVRGSGTAPRHCGERMHARTEILN